MKILLLFLLAVCGDIYFAHGQNDSQAIRVLDSFSSNASKAPSVSMTFRMISADLSEIRSDTLDGSIILSGDKYKLILGENTVWHNGETIWNYLSAEKEVTITRPDKKDHSFQNRPSEIFSMYRSGFKSRLIEDRSDASVIDLYPEDIKSDLVRVRLIINKPDLNLRSLEYKSREGLVITLEISEYNLKRKPDHDTFVFHPENYKGVEVYDMR